MQAQFKIEKIHQKGFKCSHCAATYMVAGEATVPDACTKCGQTGTLMKTWDQTVTSTVEINQN